jgi:Right handed beta helix region
LEIDMLSAYSLSLLLICCSALATLTTTSAHAVQRTFVASFGADANTTANCSLAAPCRGFAAAQTVTDNNGEIVVLDSAGYGVVTITKSISIIAPTGVYGGISVFPDSGNGVFIATAGVNVVLRGLNINGQGGSTGIRMLAGNSLTIENCVISNLADTGVNVDTPAIVNITDTIVRRNGSIGVRLQNGAKGTITRAIISSNGNDGIQAQGTTANTTTAMDISDTTVDGNDLSGVVAISSTLTAILKVSIRDSRVVRNAGNGLNARSFSGAAVTVSASNNIISNNSGTGVAAFSPGAKMIASGNTVTGNNGVGLVNSGAVIESAGNNTVRGNAAEVSGTITTVGNL